MRDIRDDIFRSITYQTVVAAIITDDGGIIAEIPEAKKAAKELNLTILRIVPEASHVFKGDEIIRFCGHPKQMAMAEDRLIGLMAKASGVATATRRFVEKAGPRQEIVSGAWKKIPLSQKEMIRRAITTGGARPRIVQNPFLYLDKNYIRMLGGIKETLEAVADLNGYVKVIQIKGTFQDISLEACEAVKYGANIIFIDSGRKNDISYVSDRLNRLGLRNEVKIAFGGNIRLEDMDELKALDLDILDIGRQIVDAPLLDIRMEIIEPGVGQQLD